MDSRWTASTRTRSSSRTRVGPIPTSPSGSRTSDRRPGFKPGDLVLIYAQATHACYAVVEVTDDPTFDPEFVNEHRDGGERWPWVNRTRPFLVPDDGRTVSPLELGFTGQSLQGGHKRLDLSQMLTAIDVLTSPASA